MAGCSNSTFIIVPNSSQFDSRFIIAALLFIADPPAGQMSFSSKAPSAKPDGELTDLSWLSRLQNMQLGVPPIHVPADNDAPACPSPLFSTSSDPDPMTLVDVILRFVRHSV